MKELKEKKNTTATEDDFFDEKSKNKEKKEGRSTLFKTLNIILWTVIIAWVALVVIDYFRVRDEKKPLFCWFNETTTTYENGTVDECIGLGYKVIKYNREDFKAIEFGPFWIEDRTKESK